MSSIQQDKLKENIGRIPDSPGVYIMKDRESRVIYVGKAIVLKNRVRSYFQSRENLDQKTRALVTAIDSIDYIATDNEVEALMLENNLIKEYRPKYNVRLKDDKRYPYLKLTTNERFPRLFLTRTIRNDGAEYFGPFSDAGAVRTTLELIKSIFPLRDCKGSALRKGKERECLNFQIGKCLAPCTGKIGEREYSAMIRQVRLFLKGHNRRLVRMLEGRMRALSDEKRYEEASRIRDQIRSVNKISERQHAVEPGGDDEDIIAISSEGEKACGVVMKIREGRILGSDSFMIPDTVGRDKSLVMGYFLQLYYHTATDIPARLFVQSMPEDAEVITAWLAEKTGAKVRLKVPERGARKRLVSLANRNATLKLVADSRTNSGELELMTALKATLGLPSTPSRVEIFDISNIQGNNAVGSMVTFKGGKPLKSGYRHFRIREVEGIDDFAMMREVLSRRARSLKSGKERHPDLIVVDGGRGQLNTAVETLKASGLVGIPVIGLAKRNEEIYRYGIKDVIVLPRTSEVLKLLQRMRDEAHRFAIEYHRKLRSREMSTSLLDGIEGIGQKRKLRLLVEFGSIKALRQASVDEIASIPGFGDKIARKIHEGISDEG